MIGGKKRTAIIEGFDGNIVGAEIASNRNDLRLVHCNQRTEDRTERGVIDHMDALNGLRGNLTETFAGDHGVIAEALAQAIGNAHHHATAEDGGVFLIAVSSDGGVDFHQIDAIEAHRTNGAFELFHQASCFFLGSFAGERIGMKMYGAER